jgi:N-acetylmuramoyl-L-alanine amidase
MARVEGELMARYPGATWHPSSISHPNRTQTRGLVCHWTAGSFAGDISTLDGPNVDVQFYVPKRGGVYQFLDSDSEAWHAFHTANTTCIGIETEGSGEAWTDVQLADMAKLCAWLCDLYSIPIRHVHPPDEWHGLFGHRDLSLGNVDGNNHTDTVPDGTGWDTFLSAINAVAHPTDEAYYFEHVPYTNGGLGPAILGQKIGYSRKATRDKMLANVIASNPDLPISTMKGDDGRYYILGWGGDSQHGEWYRSQGYALESARDREYDKRVQNSSGHPVRRFRGKARSEFPWPG